MYEREEEKKGEKERERKSLVNDPKRNERETGECSGGERWIDERRREEGAAGTPTLDLLKVLIEWGKGGKRRANRLSEAQDCP